MVAGQSEWAGPVSMALDWHAAKSFLMCNTASFMLSWCSQRERGGVLGTVTPEDMSAEPEPRSGSLQTDLLSETLHIVTSNFVVPG